MQKKVVVALSHTKKTDEYITLWRPNNSGYTHSLSSAGKYEENQIQPGYHENANNLPVNWSTAIDCSIETDEYGVAIPNDSYTLDQLGVHFVNSKLVRKNG